MASVAPPSPISAAGRPKLLVGKRVCLFCDFNFEDMELMYPKMRLEEEGATVLVVGAHEKGMKYTGKHGECESLPRVPSSALFLRHRTHGSPSLAGYPIKSDESAETVDASTFDALVIPGGFAPDYMRRSAKMLEICVAMAEAGKPVASICHGPWMLCRFASIPALLSRLVTAAILRGETRVCACSARRKDGSPLAKGIQCTCFAAIKDDLINAGAQYVDAPVVVSGPFITSRLPSDLTPFSHAIIDQIVSGRGASSGGADPVETYL